MYRVLLVDDEAINYQLFEKMVNWAEKGFEIAGTAADGLEALQKYEELQPDLIFMDIQLPFMDGLECVRCIREEDANVKIVIVSAYGDFSYAQKAIRYNVQDFLLKPVSRLMLNQLVDKMRKLLDSRELPSAAEKCFENEEARRLSLCLSGQTDLQHLNFTQKDRKLFVILMLDQSGTYLPEGAVKEHLIHMFGTLSWKLSELSAAINEPGWACILCSREDFDRKQDLIDYFDRFSLKVFLFPYEGNSTEAEWFGHLSLHDNPCFYLRQSAVFSFKNSSFSNEELRLEHVEKVIGKAIASDSKKEVVCVLDDLFKEAEKKRIRPGILKEVSLDFLIQIKFALKKLEKKESFSLLRNLKLEQIYSLQTAESLYAYIYEKIDQTFCEIDRSFFGQGNRLVFRTNAMAEICYSDSSFSVQKAADYNGISKNYFTGLYKEQAGIGFWEYVTNLRMEKARELLLSTDELVGTISSMVGYESEYHFSRKFKEYTGESPVRYRKNRRNQQK